ASGRRAGRGPVPRTNGGRSLRVCGKGGNIDSYAENRREPRLTRRWMKSRHKSGASLGLERGVVCAIWNDIAGHTEQRVRALDGAAAAL
ncbi:MAG TPA: hypothetical protein VF526_10750, partial [Solirubrobacteraceae bacterium]